MKKISIAVLFLSFCMITASSLLAAAERPTEECLILAWEKLLKDNSSTEMLEKISDRRYKFKTSIFPFEGELKINDVTIDEEIWPYTGFVQGLLEVELVGLPKDFPQKYARKYYIFARNNTLYYDDKAGKWLSSQDFQNIIAKKTTSEMSRPAGLLSYYSLLALLLALVYVFYFMFKNRADVKISLERQKNAIANVEKSIELNEKSILVSEETNRLLKEIVAVLKSSSKGEVK